MPLHENNIQNNIRLDCSKYTNRIFRNSVGTGYAPHCVHAALNKINDKETRKRVEAELNKGLITYGFGVGSSDLIGIQAIKITPDMINSIVGVFTAIEVKDPDHKTKPVLLKKQNNFIKLIKSLGGRGGFATSSDEAESILRGEN